VRGSPHLNPRAPGDVLSAAILCAYTKCAMARFFILVTVSSLLAVLTLACSDDNKGQTNSQPSASPFETQAAERAVAPADQDAYRKSVAGRGIVQETCVYESDEGIADCGERGRFALEPMPASSDASCVVGLLGSVPQFVLCTSGTASVFYQLAT